MKTIEYILLKLGLNPRNCTSLFKMLNYWRKSAIGHRLASPPWLLCRILFWSCIVISPITRNGGPLEVRKKCRESWGNSQSCVNTWHWRLGKLRALRRWFAPNRFTYVSLKTRKKRTICARAMTPHGTDGEKIMTIFSYYLNYTLYK